MSAAPTARTRRPATALLSITGLAAGVLVASPCQAGDVLGRYTFQGFPVADEEVRLCRSEAAGDCVTATTGPDGSFLMRDVPGGSYVVVVGGRQGRSLSVPASGRIEIAITRN